MQCQNYPTLLCTFARAPMRGRGRGKKKEKEKKKKEKERSNPINPTHSVQYHCMIDFAFEYKETYR